MAKPLPHVEVAFTACCILFALCGCQTPTWTVFTKEAPNPVGPYSQAIISNGLIFGAGQIGIDPRLGKIVAQDAEGQMEQALQNMAAVLKASGSDMSKLLKVTIYFKNLDSFAGVNKVYERMLGSTRPPRVAVEVTRIPLDALIEIDYIAAQK